jgi:hypothetical protein
MASINGTPGNDDLNGTPSPDLIQGFAGNDRLFGLGSNDLLFGGIGIDTARYSGSIGQYSLGGGLNGILTINDNVGNRDGQDGLLGINRLQFTDVWADVGFSGARETPVFGSPNPSDAQAAVAGLANGGWVTLAEGPADGGAGTWIFGRTFDLLGQPTGGDFLVSAPQGTSLSPSATALGNGDFVAAWSTFSGTAGLDVVGRVFDAAGNARSNPFTLSANTALDQEAVEVATLANGNFVATWQSRQSGASADVYARLFNASGVAISNEILVNTNTDFDQTNPEVAALAGGGFVVTYESIELDRGSQINYKVFDAAGNPVSVELAASDGTERQHLAPSVAGLANTAFVITWDAQQALGSNVPADVYGRIFFPGGGAATDAFAVNTNTAGQQFDASVSASQQGNFLVTWTGQDGDGGGVFGQRYDTLGNKLGGEFRVSSTATGDQGDSALAALVDGGYATAWTSAGAGVFGQRVDADGSLFGNTGVTAYKGLNYIATYADLIRSFGLNVAAGVDHYVTSGAAEGRGVDFNGLEYIASHGDLIQAFGPNEDAGTTHYVASGFAEGRATTFNGLEYIASYGDLINAFGTNISAGATHFITAGAAEGRRVAFDGLEYIASYRDLISAFGANPDSGAAHFIVSGQAEGRTTTFDGLRYIASYGDLIGAFGPNSDAGSTHFISAGVNEGRAITFDPVAYLARWADLQAAFGSDTEAATVHYITNGFAEGRAPA